MPTRPRPSWPTAPCGDDPFDDLPAADLASRHGDYLSVGGELGPEAYAEAVADYLASHDALLGGRASLQHLSQQAELVAVTGQPQPDTRSPWVCGEPATAADLARIATDFSPAAGMDAADQVLGPWADVLDVTRPCEHLALRHALAVYAVSLVEAPLGPTATRWRARRPLPSVAERARVLQVQRAPQGIWAIREVTEQGWQLQDLTGLQARYLPTSPVRVPAWGSVTSTPPSTAATVTGRAVPTETGWTLAAALVVPGVVPPAAVRAWVDLLTTRTRLTGRRDRLEGLLASRGHELARRLHCWAWSRA